MKCENCLHYEACKSMVNVIERATMYSIAMRVCNNYADKDLYIKLPCKVYDTVYIVDEDSNEFNGIDECHVRKLEWNGVFWAIFTDKDCYGYSADYIGKTVFLTREDAEKKLEELKNECK